MSEKQLPYLLTSEDRIFAFAKPAGMSIHANAESDALDFLSWVKSQSEFPDDLMLVHRLDRDTSGVVIMAQGAERCAEVGGWFAESKVSKKYIALVFGVIRAKGIVRKPLRDQRRKKPLAAVTRYRRKELFGQWSLVILRPETGRKHQIRKHLQMIGHCIVGDERYRSKRRKSVPHFPGRMWLHAYSITLPNGMSFECPLAPELEEHLTLLRARSEEESKAAENVEDVEVTDNTEAGDNIEATEAAEVDEVDENTEVADKSEVVNASDKPTEGS